MKVDSIKLDGRLSRDLQKKLNALKKVITERTEQELRAMKSTNLHPITTWQAPYVAISLDGKSGWRVKCYIANDTLVLVAVDNHQNSSYSSRKPPALAVGRNGCPKNNSLTPIRLRLYFLYD